MKEKKKELKKKKRKIEIRELSKLETTGWQDFIPCVPGQPRFGWGS